jgi:hypothetical protein
LTNGQSKPEIPELDEFIAIFVRRRSDFKRDAGGRAAWAVQKTALAAGMGYLISVVTVGIGNISISQYMT